jgi:hypothetical protein
MGNRPQWMSKVPTHVCHPATTLKEAAKVIREDAKRFRRDRNDIGARTAQMIASALERVANGETWEEAFELARLGPKREELK